MKLTDQADQRLAQQGGTDLLSRSLLYREAVVQRREVLKNRKSEFERTIQDIGLEAGWLIRRARG